MSSPSSSTVPRHAVTREITGIALLLFAVFLAGAFVSLALARLRAGVSVEGSVGAVGSFLVQPLVSFFGWPAALLLPLAPAVHALRLFGRLRSDVDRSWLIFFAGAALLLPIALALAGPAPPPGLPSAAAGWWGELAAGSWTHWFGAFGAWVVVLLATSALMAATLAWNPVRMLLGTTGSILAHRLSTQRRNPRERKAAPRSPRDMTPRSPQRSTRPLTRPTSPVTSYRRQTCSRTFRHATPKRASASSTQWAPS